MIEGESVLEIVRRKGMVVPRDIMKELGGDTFLIGAVLSQLKDSNKIKVSHTKIGGSPVYYFPGQENKLTELYKFLKFMEKKAYDLLKENGVLYDSALEPSIRVALRNIRDFAKPVEVNMKGNRLIFWKWFLLPNPAVESKIREFLSKNKMINNAAQKQASPAKDQAQEERVQPQQESSKSREPKPVQGPTKQEPSTKSRQEEQKTISEEDDDDSLPDDRFLSRIIKVFEDKDIELVSHEIIKKGKEIDMTLRIPSAVGKLLFYCKAKDKKRSNEGDLSTAYVMAGTKKLPALYATTGEITKKAEKMLDKEFKSITIFNI